MTIEEKLQIISTLAATIPPLLSAGKTDAILQVVGKMLKLIEGIPVE